MKIRREVNGVLMEFELTSQEMMDAYYEKEHQWDMAYMEELAEYLADEDRPETIKRLNAIRSNAELRSHVAYRWRKYCDGALDGEMEQDNFDEAFKYVARDMEVAV